MNCDFKNRDAIIDDYLAGKLSEQDREAFDEHCFNCDQCFHEIRLREQMVQIIKADGSRIFADYLKKRQARKRRYIDSLIDTLSRFRWEVKPRFAYAIATGVLFFFLIFWGFNNFRILNDHHFSTSQNNSRVQQPVDMGTDTIKIEKLKSLQQEIEEKMPVIDLNEAYAANFEPLPYLEEMIDDVTRSQSITVTSPRNNDTLTTPIKFNWKLSEGQASALKILDNKGHEINSAHLTDNQFILLEKIESGLYYWKLESEEELLYLGKFFVLDKEY